MTIDARAFGEVKREDIVIHWVCKDEGRRSWKIVTYANGKLEFLKGPYGGGHWRHEAVGSTWSIEKALNCEFPQWARTPEGAKRKIQQFLKDPEGARERKARFIKRILGQ